MLKFIKKLKSSEQGMRIREKFYPSKKNDPEHRILFFNAMGRYEKCSVKKNKSQMEREISVCKKFWKCYPHHYFMYDLYRKDREISENDLKKYIPHFYWYHLFLPHFRSPRYMIITANKIVTEQFFRSLEITGPQPISYILRGQFYSSEMLLSNSDSIVHDLANSNCEKIFFKPAEGSGGHGIYVFHKTKDGNFVTRQNNILNRDFLETIRKKQDYLIQNGITQHQEISKIYPNSINTFRVFTENMNGSARVVCALLRIGRGQNEIDNASSGGIFLKIDANNGNLGDFAVSYDGEKFTQHPDTGFVFRNVKISQWAEIQRFATESAGKIPYFTYLGWDIALTADGPVAIETNCNPAHDMVELAGGGLREAFAIDDPDYFWKNKGKRT